MGEDRCISDMTDEQLADLIRTQNNDSLANELIARYIGSVGIKAAKMAERCPSADRDDLFSEGLMGLLKAVRYYDKNKGASFATFANLCTDRAMKTCVAKAVREQPLVKYDDFDFDLLEDESRLTEDVVIERETGGALMKKLSGILSQTELKVLSMYLMHYTYHQIARELSTSEKSVDNALQRAKSKVKKSMGK